MQNWRNTLNLTNKTNVPLALAVGLLADYYDHVGSPNTISTTSIIKPIKQIILSQRVPSTDIDLIDYHHTFMGSAFHAALEKAWNTKEIRDKAMLLLGYKEEIVGLVEINPETPTEGRIPVYVEPPRRFKKVRDWNISGKPDLILDGLLHDYKSTSTYKWIKKDFQDYLLQLSIYRWLYDDLIHSDIGTVCFIFKDWTAGKALQSPDYPDSPEKAYELELMTLEETEKYLDERVSLIQLYLHADESLIPPCTDEELWIDPPVYKYYANPEKTDGRSTRNFATDVEARTHMMTKGKGKGIVIETLGVPKRCGYCPAYDICQQRRKYIPDE